VSQLDISQSKADLLGPEWVLLQLVHKELAQLLQLVQP
jgi:hypothetical protein